MDLNWEKDKKGVLRKFSQFSLAEASIFDWHGLDDFGYVFYPKQCADGTTICKLHIHFHGCTATLLSSSNGYNYITKYGFNEYAISNNIIIVFPQARFNLIYNQNNCWDFYGYSSILNPN
jgi:poly(3-hydroxybutyrate) depolymerase